MYKGVVNTFSYKDIEVLFEDNHLLIINKPAGLAVQEDDTGDKPLVEFVKEYIKYTYDKPGEVFIGVAHRLDRPVSGAMIFAKTSKCLERINKQFKAKEIRKTYWAVVKNRPPEEEGTLMDYLKKDNKVNMSRVYNKAVEGSSMCELDYQVIGSSNSFFLLEVNPITGRHHQIRVQLANMGCPIRGDRKYGFQRTNPDLSINLHARKLKLFHPVKKEIIEIIAPLPNDLVWDNFNI